jgi:hypothetical protein
MKGIFTCLFLIFMLNSVVGQTSYEGMVATATTNATNTTSTTLTISSGSLSLNQTAGTAFSSEPFYQATSGWTANSQTTAKEFCFSITPNPGYKMSVKGFSYQAFATSAGPSVTTFSIGSSDYTGTDLTGTGSAVTISSTIIDQNNLTSTTTFCIQGWLNGSRTTAGTGDFRIDEIVVTLDVVLPIKLSAPMAVKQNNKDVIASWATSSEENNAHFLVEHSRDGIDFETVGTVKGSRDTDSEKSYNYTHKNAPIGLNYYRLTQVDFDGKSETFEVASIEVKPRSGMSIYPTQAQDYITIEGDASEAIIYDASGRLVIKTNELNKVDVSSLHQGVYLVRSGDKTGRFVKM